MDGEEVGLNRVDLNLLLALDAMLSERNVTRAAQRLSLGQPAMSASLARLRKYFDDPLLVREGRALVPTPAAATLAPLVREAVSALEMVFERPRCFDPTLDRRSFTIMASDYVAVVLLRKLLARLAAEAPLQQVNVVPVQSDFAEQLRKGQTDLLILPTDISGPEFAFPHRYLFNDRFVLVADANNDALGTVVTAEQFAGMPYVAYSGGPMLSIADAQLDVLGVSPRTEMSTQSFVIAPFLVSGTPFVSLIHERLARQVAAQAHLKVLELLVPLRPISEALYWNPRHTSDPAQRWLREQVVTFAEELDHDSG